jgi:molybdate transport system permease protein
VPGEYIEAAQELGAGPLRRFFYIILPCAWRGAATGATLSWCRSLGEFGATLLFAGNLPGRTQTMPLAIYVGFESNIQQALALSPVLLVPVVGVLLLIQFVEPRHVRV